jgi:hypothetical protein
MKRRLLTVLVLAASMLVGNTIGTGLAQSMNRKARSTAKTKARMAARRAAPDVIGKPVPCPLTTAVKFANATPTGAAISFTASCGLAGLGDSQCAFLIIACTFQLNPATGQYVELPATFSSVPIQLNCGVSEVLGATQAAGPGSGLGPGTYVFSCGIFQMLPYGLPGRLIVGTSVPSGDD